MKNYVKPLQKALVFLLSTVLLYSCNQIETFDGPDLSEAQARIPVQFKSTDLNARVGTGFTACGTPMTHKLMAGQTIPVGEVTVFNDQEKMYVTVSIEKGEGFDQGDWFIRKIHAYFGQVEIDFVTKGKKGIRNPAPGQFPISEAISLDYGNANQEYTYELEISEDLKAFGEFDVAVHAEVVRVTDIDYVNNTAVVVQSEGAWAGDNRFNPEGVGNWSLYMSYQIQDCAKICQDSWFRYLSRNGDDPFVESIPDEDFVFDLSLDNNIIGKVNYQRTGVRRSVCERVGGCSNQGQFTTYWDYTIKLQFSINVDKAADFSFLEYSAFTTGDVNDQSAIQDSKTVTNDADGGIIELKYTLQSNGTIPTYYLGMGAKIEGPCKN
jgi:hypothetical protein